MTPRLPPVFVDTGAFVALAHQRPEFRQFASAAARQGAGMGKAHTSDFVVLEAYSFIARNRRREAAMEFLDFATGPAFVLHPPGGDLVDEAIARARARPLKRELSLVDWTNVVLMERHGIRHILTTDRGFRQLSFQVLP